MKDIKVKKIIVAITGRKGCGKSHLTAELLKGAPFRNATEIIPIAETLKEVCALIYGHKEYFHDPALKEKKHPNSQHTARKIMQHIGTEAGRALDQDVWLNGWERKVKQFFGMTKDVLTETHLDHFPHAHRQYFVLVDDLRFDNEAQRIKDLGGIIIRVKSNEIKQPTDLHASEQGIDDKYVDLDVVNDGATDKYVKKVIDFISLRL